MSERARGTRRASSYARRLTGWPRTTALYPRPYVRPRPARDPVVLYGILATWNEADVVEASIANAFAQGCERVFLIDNDSDDDTVDLARQAGAELVESYTTAGYDEGLRIRRMNLAVRSISMASSHERIWWLYMDADEFAHGRDGRTLHQELAELDPRYRVVGATYLNHFPTETPANIPAFHPIDLQPMCDRMFLPNCFLGHHKHPLLRFDAADAESQLLAGRGFHTLATPRPHIGEPTATVLMHHFPFRNEEVTRWRLAKVNERCSIGNPSHEREQFIDAVYRGDWERVLLHRRRIGDAPVRLVDWQSAVPASDRQLRRWYAPADLADALDAGSAPSRTA